MAKHSAQELCEAFNRVNEKATWNARPNSRDTFDRAIFHSPSDLIEISFDALQGRFVVRFVKTEAPFRTYMLSIAKAFTYVLECLASAGLPFVPPPKPSDVEVRCALSEAGDNVTVWWSGMMANPSPGGDTIDDAITALFKREPELAALQPENNSESS